MLRRFFIVRDRRKLVAGLAAAPFALLAIYWFVLVGLTNPASRLKKDIEAHAKETRVVRVPATFVHRPINQFTRPLRDFNLTISAGGEIRMSRGSPPGKLYTAQLGERIAVAGDFELSDIGSAVEIELMPGGRTVDLAAVKAMR
jgi:hypothetical protein